MSSQSSFLVKLGPLKVMWVNPVASGIKVILSHLNRRRYALTSSVPQCCTLERQLLAKAV